MEGLEISVVKLSEVNNQNRFDTDFYMKRYLINENQLLNKKHLYVSDYFTVTDGEHGSVEYLEHGVKYLTAENIKNGFIDISNIRYVSEDVDRRNKRASVNVGDILISIKGTLGQIAIAKAWIKPANMNRDIAIMKTKKQIIGLSEYLAIFLMTSMGEIQCSRGGSGGVQQMITLERLRKFIIPSLSEDFYKVIKYKYDSSLHKLEESKSLYSQAEDLLLGELGLKDWRPKNTLHTTKKFSDFVQSGRLDAEYYQPKYDEIEKAIKSYKGGYDIVSNLFNQNVDVCDYKKTEYNYVEIGDVNVGDGSVSFNKVETSELPDNAKRILHKNDILISKVRPYRGAVAIIDFEQEDLIGSGAFTVLQEKSTYKKETLQILFRTAVYKDWLLKWNVGSSYPVIKDEDILNLPIPILPDQIQTKIASLIQQSFECKAQSKQLLEDAKRMVEEEIEKN